MTARTFTPVDLVSLPRLNAAEALALLVSLESAAKPHADELPEAIKQALGLLKTARISLQRARAQRRHITKKADPKKIREADNTIDRCWRALEQWAGALRLLPPGYIDAREQLDLLYEALFGEGMGFLNERFEVEWAESDTRLDQIKRDGFAATIEKLGGQVLLQAIRDAHQTYGELLGITAVQASEPTQDALAGEDYRQLFLQVQRTIRAYVAEAAVLSHRPDASQQKLALALLKPLAEWSSRPSSPADDGDDEETPGEDTEESGSGEAQPKPQ